MRCFSRIYLYPVSLLELSSQLTPEMQPFVSFCPFDLRSLIRFFADTREEKRRSQFREERYCDENASKCKEFFFASSIFPSFSKIRREFEILIYKYIKRVKTTNSD